MTSTEWPICIVVFGKVEPAGSKTSFIPKSNDLMQKLAAAKTPDEAKAALTGLRSNVVDANPKASSWKDLVAWSAVDQYKGEPLHGPLDMELVFVLARRKGDYGTGKNAGVLKDTAPLHPAVRPDTTKLTRGVEDALTGIVWIDDGQVVNQWCQKRYGDRPRVEIRVRPTAVTCVRDLVMLGEMRPSRPMSLVGEGYEQLALV